MGGYYMIIAKEFMFHSAHFLPNYNGKCEKIHGHSYKLQVFVEDKVNSETGMIIDFYDFIIVVKLYFMLYVLKLFKVPKIIIKYFYNIYI